MRSTRLIVLKAQEKFGLEIWENFSHQQVSEHMVRVKTTKREYAISELGEEKKRDELKKRVDLGQK